MGVQMVRGTMGDFYREEGKQQISGVHVRQDRDRRVVRSRIAVDARGYRGKLLNKNDAAHTAIAARMYVDKSDLAVQERRVEFHLPGYLLPRYGWVFPSEGESNVGGGMRLDKMQGSSLDSLVRQFLLDDVMRGRLSVKLRKKLEDDNYNLGDLLFKVWTLRFGSQEQPLNYHGAIAVGDAASLINPISGGGIGNTVASAIFGAEVIAEVLKEHPSGDITAEMLQPYNDRVWEELGPALRKSYQFARVLERIPLMADVIVKLGRTNSLFARLIIDSL